MPTQRRRAQMVEDDEPDDNRGPQQGRNADEDEDEDDEEDEEDDRMEVDGAAGISMSRHGLLAKKLVRYAIACEYSRTVIRREGIKERVLGNQGRAFRPVFAIAQAQLRRVFGMELRELPVREKLTLQERRQALKANSQPKAGSGTYILTSILPKEYRTGTILPPSKTPRPDAEASYAGFYTFVTSIIMLSGGEISEQKLRRYLARMNADQNVADDKTENIFLRMQKQGYIIKKVEKVTGGEDENVSWLVGPRGKEEIGIEGVAGMVKEVYGGSTPELDERIAASLGIGNQAADENAQDGEEENEESRIREPAGERAREPVRESIREQRPLRTASVRRSQRRTRGGDE